MDKSPRFQRRYDLQLDEALRKNIERNKKIIL